jgi:hypothetical protein
MGRFIRHNSQFISTPLLKVTRTMCSDRALQFDENIANRCLESDCFQTQSSTVISSGTVTYARNHDNKFHTFRVCESYQPCNYCVTNYSSTLDTICTSLEVNKCATNLQCHLTLICNNIYRLFVITALLRLK